MKTIGIIGGLLWPSSASYYQRINQLVAQKAGAFHCANLVLVQTDFDTIKNWAAEGRWDEIGKALASAARQLESAGADFILIACNTMHKVITAIENDVHLPVLHIVDVTAAKVKHCGFKTVGLLGTVYTMTDDYFRGRLADKHDIRVFTPTQEQHQMVQEAVSQEIVRGCLADEERVLFRQVIDGLVAQGCEAIILGCTELGRYLDAEDAPVPLIDTLVEHVEAAVKLALAE